MHQRVQQLKSMQKTTILSLRKGKVNKKLEELSGFFEVAKLIDKLDITAIIKKR